MTQENNHLELISISHAAELMHIGKETLYELINSGKIGVIQLGKRLRIPLTELNKFIENNTIYYANSTFKDRWSDEVSVSSNRNLFDYNTDDIFNQIKGKYING